jgi:hypothetical protein
VTEPARDNVWGIDRARYWLAGGNHISIRREPASVHLQLQLPVPEEAVLTPHLSSAASSFAIWRGAEPFHGGAFVHNDSAWVILGAKGVGKTSTLAALAELGLPVLADDLSIYDHGLVLAGPRALDLRSGPAAFFGAGKDLGVIGTRRRWRIYLPQVPSAVRMRGLLLPCWGDAVSLEPVSVADRMRLIPQFRALRLPWDDPETLLEIASFPMLRWTRLRNLSTVHGDAAMLLEQLPG